MGVRTSRFKNSFIPLFIGELNNSYAYCFIFILVCKWYWNAIYIVYVIYE